MPISKWRRRVRSVRGGRGAPGRAGHGTVPAALEPPASPVCFVSSPGPPWRKEEPSAGQERVGTASRPPHPHPPSPPGSSAADRGSSASLVQWFLTVQQFSIIIVKCLGPLDQRGPGIGPAAADERAPLAPPETCSAGGRDGPGPRPERSGAGRGGQGRGGSRRAGANRGERGGPGGGGAGGRRELPGPAPQRRGLGAPGTGGGGPGAAGGAGRAAGPAAVGVAERVMSGQVL